MRRWLAKTYTVLACEPAEVTEAARYRDIGYPRSIQRPDGRVVTVYYWCDDLSETRYIVATIWDPNSVGK